MTRFQTYKSRHQAQRKDVRLMTRIINLATPRVFAATLVEDFPEVADQMFALHHLTVERMREKEKAAKKPSRRREVQS